MATNFLAARNSNLSSFNAVSINYSTIRGSTIASVSTMNVSTIVNSNITAVGINYSTLVGSSIVNNTVITQSLAYSTLTGSSITGSALTVGNIQGTSVSASTITTTGNVGIGTVNPYGKLHVLLSNAPTVPAGNTWTSGWAVFGDNTGATPAGNGNAVGIAFNLTANASLPAGGLLYSIAPNAAWNPMNYSAANHNFSISGSLTPAMTIISNGNVGIGTATVNAPLQFASTTANRKIVLYETTNNDHQYFGFGVNANILRYQVDATSVSHVFYAGTSSTTSNELMRISGNGNVGIGITNPSSMLHVNGTTTFGNGNGTSNSNTNAGIITAPDSGGQVSGSTSTNNYGTSLNIYGGRLTTAVWNNSNYGGDIVLAGGDMVDTGNNGSAAGSYVGGNILIRSGRVTVNNSAGNTQTVIPGSIFFQIGSGSRNTSSSLGDYNTAMTIASSGNVGIGTTNPTGTLQITSTYAQSGIWPGPTLNFQVNGGAHWMAGAIVGYIAANAGGTAGYPGGLAFQTKNPDNVIETAPTTKMVIDSNGNVGIGTVNPGYALDIRKSLQLTGNAFSTALSDNIFFNVKADDSFNGNGSTTVYSNSINLRAGDLIWTGNRVYGAQIYIGGGYSVNGAVNHGVLKFSTGNAERMTILGNGNVGIGTNNPSSPLHIYANTSNILTLDSSLGPTYMSFSANGAARALIGIDNSEGTGLFGSNVAYGLGIGTLGNTPTIFVTNNAIRMTIASNGNVSISGSLSKGSGTFDIEHPLYPNTKRRLVHSFIEGPRCDLIYRGIIVLTNGSASVYIDKQCTYTPENAMDDGTFEALCVNPQYFLQNMSGFNRVIGSIYRGILTITCENNTATDTISWMVVAERKDPFVKNWDRTDSNGYLNTQYMK